MSGNSATITPQFSGQSGQVSSLTLTGDTDARQLDPAATVVHDLLWGTPYRLCGSAQSAGGANAKACTDFTSDLSPDPCHPHGIKPTAVSITIEWFPNTPNPGATIDGGTGFDCWGNMFMSNASLFYLDNGGHMSYKALGKVSPNLPNGTKPIQFRLPMFNQGRYLGDATPDNGTFYINGVKVTGRGGPMTITANCNCIPDAVSVTFNVDTAGKVTP